MTVADRPLDQAPDQLARWRLVLPVKGMSEAKSRLAVGAGVSRIELARAMALDTIQAALSCPIVATVLVVTSDVVVRAEVAAAGALVLPDPGLGLNAAIRHGADHLASVGPGPVAALLADLPALAAADLAAALSACAGSAAAYVPDAEGSGTVLLAAATAAGLRPAFGDGSAGRHDLFATRLDLDLPRLRRDVDVQSALREAVALGVGPRTTAALATADLRFLA